MTAFVGIDGIRGGWVAVYLYPDDRQRFAYASTIARLLLDPYQRAMVDMPIGLPASGYRKCDEEARALVGSRVFLGARFGVWNYETLDEANAWYWKNEGRGKGISMQLFNIKDKLQELSAGPVPPRLFEAHPELIFRRIAGKVLESKKIDAGRRERIAILKRLGIASIERWLGRRYNTRIGRDDLIHACACAIVARDSKDKLPAGCGHTTMVRNRKSGISWLVV